MRNFPRVQAIPYPDRLSYQIDGKERVAYCFNPLGNRPFIFPVIGPSGKHVTRIGHPHDPVTHAHHMSVWSGYRGLNGINFWEHYSEDSGRQVHRNILKITDEGERSSAVFSVDWVTADDRCLMNETRELAVQPVGDTGELVLHLVFRFHALVDLQFNRTPFGLLGVRVAKTMTVNDGGGVITNSELAKGEKDIFWKRARWCDYSGPVGPDEWNGVTVFDHPSNPFHPSHWHVRSDGWMCPSLFLNDSLPLSSGKKLGLKYMIHVHAGRVDIDRAERMFTGFCQENEEVDGESEGFTS